ncbi:MAG: cardiolipin synthase [Epsilonproteobacteria bacterium]|nr:MAG: cardiolipin synthase [Campylobacterota bacterium]
MSVSQLLFTYFIIIFGALLVFTAIGHILYQKRSPTSMISWMMAIVFLPFITVPLYFIIGIRKRESKHTKEYVKFHTSSSRDTYNLDVSNHSILSILEKNGILPATKGNTFELITNSTEAYEKLLEEIARAKYCIDICTYVFVFDKTTKVILEALTKRAKDGLQVRLLLDLVGSLGANFNQKGFNPLREAGGEVAFFVPILKRPLQNYINLRNHRKIYLFDQSRLLSGGMNLSDEYMGEDDGTKRWEDLMYALTGPSVDDFYAIFHNDWSYATKKSPKRVCPHKEDYSGEQIAQVVPSGPDIPTDALYETLLNAIYNAKERIWIVTPYFVPDDNIVQALVIAQHKGVDVKLITPKNSDHLLADIGRSPYMRELDDIGVDVVLYEGEMLHAKAILFDSLGGMVGSVNLDNRSLFLNYEVVTFVYSQQFIESIEVWMEKLMLNATRGMQKPSKLREAIENIMKVFAPLL